MSCWNSSTFVSQGIAATLQRLPLKRGSVDGCTELAYDAMVIIVSQSLQSWGNLLAESINAASKVMLHGMYVTVQAGCMNHCKCACCCGSHQTLCVGSITHFK